MKIIFLDIDGVLNTAAFRREKGLAFYRELVDSEKLAHLKKIVDNTGAKIVLTSSWRTFWNEGAQQRDSAGQILHDAFDTCGLCIASKIPVIEAGRRGDEIQAWLDGTDRVEEFVILDDLDHRWNYRLRTHFVQTEGREEGLNDTLADVAIKVLNGELLSVPKTGFLRRIVHWLRK